MSLSLLSGRWCRWSAWLVVIVLTLGGGHLLVEALSKEPIIVLGIDGTYEDMRKLSSAPFSPLIPGQRWMGMPKTDAQLHFVDPQYGFVTPRARFFTVGFNANVVEDVRMSPQVEPLLIDDALKVVLDLQAQWRAKGWKPVGLRNSPTMADTPEWRAWLRKGIWDGRSFWQAGDKYQAMLLLARFKDRKRPCEERYLITLSLAKPWLPFSEDESDPTAHPTVPVFPSSIDPALDLTLNPPATSLFPHTNGASPCQPQPS